MPKSSCALTTMWGCAIFGGRRGEGGWGGRGSHDQGGEVTRLGWCLWREPGSLPVVYLVTKNGIWGTGSDDVGLIQSTTAPFLVRQRDVVPLRKEGSSPKRKGGLVVLLGRPRSSFVVYLVTQNRNLEYGGRRCGFNTQHQSTKAEGRGVSVGTPQKDVVSQHQEKSLHWHLH